MMMVTRLLLLLVSAAGLVTSDLLSTLIMCGGDLFNCDLDHLSSSGLDPVKLFLLSQAASFQNYDGQYYQQQDDHPHYHQYQYPHQYQYTPDASTSLYLDDQNSQYPQNQYYQYYDNQYYGQQYQYDHHHGHYDSYYQGSQYYNPALSTRSHSSPDYSQYYGSSHSFDPSYSNYYSHLGHSAQFSPNVPADLPRPEGATLKFDLLSNVEAGLQYPEEPHLGVFTAQSRPARAVNEEDEEYVTWAATQDHQTGAVSIRAQKHSNGNITSARLESQGTWSTASSEDTRLRGYVEVITTIPAKTHHLGTMMGAWPAIWMLGRTNVGWPQRGEIDLVETINGDPRVYMTMHSSTKNGKDGQKPAPPSFEANTDFTVYPLVAGLEWNVTSTQIDLTWWMSYFDTSMNQWQSLTAEKILHSNGEDQSADFDDFYQSFTTEGFSLIINLAQGGNWPGHTTFVTGEPQYMIITSAKVYGF